MAICDTCGNDYPKSFQIIFRGKTFNFDCFECAVHLLAPACEHCGCKIIGHDVERAGKYYCCRHCADQVEKKKIVRT